MKRTTCPAQRIALAVLLPCLGALVGWWNTSPVGADEWFFVAPDQSARSRSVGPPSIADSFFSRAMGVGSTRTARDKSTAASGYFKVPTGSERYFFDPSSVANDDRDIVPVVQVEYATEAAFRTGWWDVTRRGAVTKVGEYQDLKSSPFWDVDLIRSNGKRTVDLFGTGLDNESAQAGLYLFSPEHSFDLRYQRFLHRLDHDPLTNIPPPSSGEEIVSDDLNVGEDFAVRVQDFRTSFRGKLTKDVKYRLNVWLRRKQGERQALGPHHGAPGVTDCRECHVVNQRQTIDWTTIRIEPIIEARIGPVKVEYSRPMRSFSQDDGVVVRSYGGFHGYDYAGDFPYAVVPETVSQTDRLKLSLNLPASTQVYARLHRGDTRNKLRDTRRDFYGVDFRVSNTYSPKLTLNSFARLNRQLNQFPPFLVPPEDDAVTVPTASVPPYGLRQPIDYLRWSTGANARWRPFRLGGRVGGLALNAGAEYGQIRRSYAEYVTQNPPGLIDQAATPYISYFAGTTMKWHPRFDTFVRYKGRLISDPLFGVNLYWGATNTNRPEQENEVQFGGTWLAADNLVASASVGIENRKNSSEIANFTEDNYPMTFMLWYAPKPAWSVSGSYGYYSNWIDQDILFPSDNPLNEPFDRRRWNYGGRGQVLSFDSRYQWSKSITLTGSLQHVWTIDAFDPLAPWPDLPVYSQVIVNKTRYSGGVDWYANERISAYVRYIYEDYEDVATPLLSGSAHMFLGGLTALF